MTAPPNYHRPELAGWSVGDLHSLREQIARERGVYAPAAATVGVAGKSEQASQHQGTGQGSAPPHDRAAALAHIEERIVYIDTRKALEAPPPPRKFIVKGYLPAGTVTLFNGEGASGKTYMIEGVSVAIAIGRTVPPFEVVFSGTVLFVSVEDDELALSGRLYRIGQELGLSLVEQDLLHANLIIASARGVLGPLMEFDQAGNPRPAIGTDWLRQKMEETKPVLVVLDTKSRLFGLQENSNDDGAAWISNLESLLVDHPDTTFLVVSHVGKKSDDAKANQYGARGASSFVDNSRSVLALVEATDAEKKRLRATDIGQVHRLVHAKSSYSQKMEDAFFIKNPHGVPVHIDAEFARDENMSTALDELVDVLVEEHPEGLNKKQLRRADNQPFKRIRDGIIERAGIRKMDWDAVINLGVESGRLVEREDATSEARTKPILILVKAARQEGRDDGPEQQNLCWNW